MEANKVTAPVVRTMSEYLPEPFVDETTDAIYYGWAPLGVGETDNGWRIMKETKNGTVTKREYANGSMDFAFAWSERANYDYSR